MINNKKKVLHMLSSLNAGGAETNLLALMAHFDSDVYEHAVAYGGENGALEPEFRSAGIKLIQLSPVPLGVGAFFKYKDILSRIKQFSPDIIHSHLDLTNVFGLLAKKSFGSHLVIHFHGLGMIPHKLLPNRPFKHRLWNVIARSYKKCDKAIAICTFQIPFLLDLGFKKEQIDLIPNGINFDSDEPISVPAHEGYKFVNVGRFQPQKDHRMLVDAFKGVVKKVPSAKLILVGDGQLRSSIEEQVLSLGLENSVEFLGVRRDIPEILANSDCFVLGSRWELHPITILEAMRTGLPVIASDVGGISDTVDDGNTGLLIEAENTSSLESAMIELALDVERGKNMGANGLKRVKKHFNNAIVAQQIEQVYRDVLSDSRAS
ncbi:MAG TPA: glycosyltransferase family 1 protein [Gammaproteobacteria bacterium]|nr:glycosyltransferase family 1 protein [Gammaproteobacteria bacterium]